MTITLPLATACHVRGHAWITTSNEDAPSDATTCSRCGTNQSRPTYAPRHLRPSGAPRTSGAAPLSPT